MAKLDDATFISSFWLGGSLQELIMFQEHIVVLPIFSTLNLASNRLAFWVQQQFNFGRNHITHLQTRLQIWCSKSKNMMGYVTACGMVGKLPPLQIFIGNS